MDKLLGYREAEKLLRKLYRNRTPAYGIDGFEEANGEAVYVATELLPENPRSITAYLQALQKLYRMGCSLFSISYK